MLTQEQIQDRLNYVTGSDAAVICGLSPFKTKLQLWMEKTGRVIAEDISGLNHIKFGNYFEDGVAKWFEADSGFMVKQAPQMLIHRSLPWMAGNIDRLVDDGRGGHAILECKTAFNDDGWGRGENIIPAYYLMQVAHYCAIGPFDRAYIAVVFAAKREMRWYVYERNLELEEKLIAREQEFWINNVKADIAPEPINEQDILSLYKETNSNPMVASSELEATIDVLLKLQKEIKIKLAQAEDLKTNIKMVMKDCDTLLDNSGKIIASWKYTKPIQRFDTKSLRTDAPEVYEKYMRLDEPQRRFVIKGGEDE